MCAHQTRRRCSIVLQSTDLDFQYGSRNGVEESQITTTDPHNLTQHKIHIRGVDDLTTDDIKTLSLEHLPLAPPIRIEWIDDTSANIVYDTPGTGLTALDRLSLHLPTTIHPTELRTAKPFSKSPESILQVRSAFISDQKKPRAYEASRFYMMHPEHDPREQRRQGKPYQGNDDYRRKRYGDKENQRRSRRDKEEGFEPSMYDDHEARSSRRGSLASSSEGRSQRVVDSYRPRPNGVKENRDRSASPIRDGVRRSDQTPPPAYRMRDPHPFPAENSGKELFPIKSKQGSEMAGQELFSDRLLTIDSTKELFPHKTNSTLHRRSDAFDAADETADLFANGMSVPFTDGSKIGGTRSLTSRITAPSESSYGRLSGRDRQRVSITNGDDGDDGGLNIRGASQQDQGFSIRGSAAGTMKELFPNKTAGNAGKELFAQKLEGRGARRTRAEDMFY